MSSESIEAPVPLACDASKVDGYGGGDGTPQSPFTICTLEHLALLSATSTDWQKSFRLEADIDFTGVSLAEFSMIGSAATPFTGSLDGNGYTLRNLDLQGATVPLALFSQTDGAAKISNLTLENFTLETTARAAALILDHDVNGTLTLENIELLNVSVSAAGNTSAALVGNSDFDVEALNIVVSNLALEFGSGSSGGLFGLVTGRLTVENVQADGLSLIGSFTNTNYAGSVVGTAFSGGLLKNIVIDNLTMDSGWASSGAVGRSYGPIDFERVNISGTIEAGGGQSGLIGEAWGWTDPADVTIVESSFEGTLVNAGNTSYGGLGGALGDNVVIQRSYFSGSAGVWSGTFGGLVGNAAYAGKTLVIEDSYAIGNWGRPMQLKGA